MVRACGVLLGCVLVASCGGGGGGGNPPPAPATFTIGGTVTGLAGSGLTLLNNAGVPLAVNSSGAFAFSGTVASGSSYNVTVGTQPAGPTQLCLVTSGTGAATSNVTSIGVNCTTLPFTVGFTVSGLFGTGLTLQNSGGTPLLVTANGAFTFPTGILSGAAYNVTVQTQPTATPPQTCTVSAGAGTIGSGPVTSVAVQCRAQAGRFAYVAVAGTTPATNGVAAFTIDANTGALTPMSGSPFPTTGQAPRVLFSRVSNFLYVYGDDDINAPGATTLSGFAVNPQTGALTPIQGLQVNLAAAAAPPAFHPSGNFVYIPVSDGVVGPNNRLRGFAIDSTTGMLAESPFSPWTNAASEILNSAVLSPNGATLYLATSTLGTPGVLPTGRIRRFAVDAPTPGDLFEQLPQVADPGNSFYGLFMHSLGTHMYTRNSTGPMFASRFTLDVVTGAIGARLDIPTAFGFGLVLAPRNRVYFAGFGGAFGAPQPGSVAGYVDFSFGPTNALPNSPYSTGGTNSLAQVLDPTGRFLAVTNLGSADVTVMRIDDVEGSLAHAAGSPYDPSVGTLPGSVTFDPSARFAYLTDGAGSISSYSIDVDTGVPTFVSSQPIGGAPAVVPVTILGLQ